MIEEMGIAGIEVVESGVPKRDMWASFGLSSLDVAREFVRPCFAGKDEVYKEMVEGYAKGAYALTERRVVIARNRVRERLSKGRL